MSVVDVLKVVGGVVTGGVKELAEHDGVQKMIFGTYTNGDTRSVVDAVQGEVFSPEDRLAIARRLEKHEKKKKKKQEKGKKYAEIDLDEPIFEDEDK